MTCPLRRFGPARLLLVFSGLLLAAGTLEASTRMRYQPQQLRADAPFEVMIAADFEFALVDQSFDGSTYSIVTRRTGPISTGVLTFVRTIRLDAPALPPNYPLRNYLEWRERRTDGSEIILETRTLNFELPVRMEAPDTITDQDQLVVKVSGRSFCPWVGDAYLWYDGVIYVDFADGCAGISPIQDFDFSMPPLPPLPAGRYRIVLRDIRAYPLLSEREVTVLPTEARLQDDRFAVKLTWNDGTANGSARPAKLPGEDSAVFYFFDPANWEFLVKVLDGCALNGHYWVFGAASTAVGYTLEVRDLERPELGAKQYTNDLGQPAAAITDILAFPCQENQP